MPAESTFVTRGLEILGPPSAPLGSGIQSTAFWMCEETPPQTLQSQLQTQGCPTGPVGYMRPRMALNGAKHRIVNLLKTFFFFCSSVFISVCVFNVWTKTTLLPVWPRDAYWLDTPASDTQVEPMNFLKCFTEPL